MDESGIHEGSHICVVAGFIAPLTLCRALEAKWRTVLNIYGIKFFHAKEFANGSGQFLGWKNDRKQKFLQDALGTIIDGFYLTGPQKRRPLSIAIAIHISDFKALSIDQRRWLTGGLLAKSENVKWKTSGAPNKPYFLAFQQCVIDAIRFGLKEHSERAHFVFDRQSEFERSALSLCDAMRSQHKDIGSKMGEIVFSSKETAILLQVADFMAYEAYQHKIRELKYKRPQPLSDNAHILFNDWNAKRRLISIDGKQLDALLNECPMRPGQRFRWPNESLHPKHIPLGAKVVRFPRD
jgi:hypothetical protein